MAITRGFVGPGRSARDSRLPPGQHDVGEDWPVLHVEATPSIDTEDWTFSVDGLVDTPTTWTWDEIRALPGDRYEGDIHCVTTWSKFDMTFDGVSVDTLLELAGLQDGAAYVMARSHTGYATNLPVEDVTDGRAWVVWDVNGAPLEDVHGAPPGSGRGRSTCRSPRPARARQPSPGWPEPRHRRECSCMPRPITNLPRRGKTTGGHRRPSCAGRPRRLVRSLGRGPVEETSAGLTGDGLPSCGRKLTASVTSRAATPSATTDWVRAPALPLSWAARTAPATPPPAAHLVAPPQRRRRERARVPRRTTAPAGPPRTRQAASRRAGRASPRGGHDLLTGSSSGACAAVSVPDA
jgi:hypothetical protein